MFKKIVTASLAAATMTASAYAADLPRRAPPPLPPPPVYGWTGCYVGANGGGAWITRSGFGNNTNSDLFVETVGVGGAIFPISAGTIAQRNSQGGGFGGGQIGCNLQTGMFVFGAEIDAQGSRISSTGFGSAPNIFGGLTSVTTTQRLDYFGTARGRVGITFGGFGGPGWGAGGPGGFGFGGPVLLYVTGGFAFAGVRDGFVSTTGIPGGPAAAPATFTLTSANIGNNGRVGFAAGGGIEWMFLPNWSVKGEYQYIGLQRGPVASATEFFGGLGTPFLITRRDPALSIHTARIGINYHFFSAPAPVVARY